MAFFDELKKVLHVAPDDDYVRVVRDPRCAQNERVDDDDEYDDDDDDMYDDDDDMYDDDD